VSRNQKLEAYLTARWDLEQCEPAEMERKLQTLNEITLALLSEHPGVSPRELAAITNDAYREYCRVRYHESLKNLSRLR
jgi:hypothetical protein